MTQRQPCRFRRHDFGNGACMIELMRDGRTFGVIRRGSFDKPFDIGAKPEVFRSMAATIDDDLGRCLARRPRHVR
ncbi:MAG: hypothetical protein JO110_23210 [Acetobacteraceae bacterium]|nr:hypothetical protein [Acetobacteraceae bacterium]